MIDRRRLLQGGLAAAAGLASGPVSAGRSPWVGRGGTLRIGFLWSLTGHLSVIERPSRDVGLFWADQVNRAGGIAGFEVEPVVIDTFSDIQAYRRGCLRLLLEDNVLAIFGGYTSASRRAVMPLVTKHGGLFYYPTCYEGRECWQHIICTGPIANQHSRHLIPFMVQNFGPRAFFVGSNYVWPVESNRNARTWLDEAGGTLVAESYMPLGQGEFGPILEQIRHASPDWIFSTLIGVSDVYFRQAYARAGFRPDRIPTASLTTSEMEVRHMGLEFGEGHLLSAPYFQSLDTPTNRRFVEAFLSSPWGESGVTHYNMEETYLALLHFANAVEALVADLGPDAITPARVRAYSAGLTLSAAQSPEGEVRIDAHNFNSHLTPKIGRFNGSGQVDLLLATTDLIAPRPYLLYPTRGSCRADGLHLPDGRIVRAAS